MSSAACCTRHPFKKSRFLDLERKAGGSFHLRLDSSSGLVVNKYHEGKVKRILERELNSV